MNFLRKAITSKAKPASPIVLSQLEKSSSNFCFSTYNGGKTSNGLGSIEPGGTMRLLDLNVYTDENNSPIIQVEVVSNPSGGTAEVGSKGWIWLSQTNINDAYELGSTKKLSEAFCHSAIARSTKPEPRISPSESDSGNGSKISPTSTGGGSIITITDTCNSTYLYTTYDRPSKKISKESNAQPLYMNDTVELLDTTVYKDQWNCNIIHVKGIKTHHTVNQGLSGWVNLSDTSAKNHFDAGSMRINFPNGKAPPSPPPVQKPSSASVTVTPRSAVTLRSGGVAPSAEISITQQTQESFYQVYDGSRTSSICGNVHVSAVLRLIDLKVYKDESSFDILHIQVVSNPGNEESLGKTGYVRLKNTNISAGMNASTRMMEVVTGQLPNGTSVVLRAGGIIAPSEIIVTQHTQESFYLNYDGVKTSGICGSVNVSAVLRLVDLKVYKDESSFDILYIQVVANPNNPDSTDKMGYVRVKNTDMVSAVDATKRMIDTTKIGTTKSSVTPAATPVVTPSVPVVTATVAPASPVKMGPASAAANEITMTNTSNSTSIYLAYDKAEKKITEMQGSHLHCGDVVQLLDNTVYKDQWNCNIIHIKGLRCHYPDNNGKVGWINLSDTDAVKHFNVGTMQIILSADANKSGVTLSSGIALRPGGIAPAKEIIVNQRVAESLYLVYNGERTSSICGDVKVNARMRLLDLKVYKDESSFDILNIQILENGDNKESINKTGWVRVKNTDMTEFVGADRQIDITRAISKPKAAPLEVTGPNQFTPRTGGTAPTSTIIITQTTKESFYQVFNGERTSSICGDVNVGATAKLLDLKVYHDESGFDIVHIQVLSNGDNKGSLNKTGYVRLKNTDAQDKMNKSTRMMEFGNTLPAPPTPTPTTTENQKPAAVPAPVPPAPQVAEPTALETFQSQVPVRPESDIYLKVTKHSGLFAKFNGSHLKDPICNVDSGDTVQLLDLLVYKHDTKNSDVYVAKVKVVGCHDSSCVVTGWLRTNAIQLNAGEEKTLNQFTKKLINVASTAQWPLPTADTGKIVVEPSPSPSKVAVPPPPPKQKSKLEEFRDELARLVEAQRSLVAKVEYDALKQQQTDAIRSKNKTAIVQLRDQLKSLSATYPSVNLDTVTGSFERVASKVDSLLSQVNAHYEVLLEEQAVDESKDAEVDLCDELLEEVTLLLSDVRLAGSKAEDGNSSPLSPLSPVTPSAGGNGNATHLLQLSTSIGKAEVSSGSSYIMDALYFTEGSTKFKPMEVKVKLSADLETLQKEFDVLHMMSEQAANYFVRAFKFLDHKQIAYSASDDISEDTRRSLYGIVMQRGEAHNLKWFLNHNKMHLDLFHRLPYAIDVIKIVAALHRMNYAWMDVKPHNFVTVRNEHNMQRLLGIDLDHARELDNDVPVNYNEVTWEYASPEFAHRDPHTGYIVSSEDRPLSTPEQYDVWSLGVTVLEILDDGNSFCSRVGGDIPAIQAKLRNLTDEAVAKHVNARFVGNDLQTRAIRSFLLTTLKVNAAERPRACELLEVIQGSKISGFTATNKLIRDGFQKQEEHFEELREMLTKMQHSLSSFQGQIATSFQSVAQALQTDASGSDLAHHADELSAVSKGILQTASCIESAVSADEVERIFKQQFQGLVAGFLTNALTEAQESMNISLTAALESQQTAVMQQFKNFTAIQEAGAKCNEKQFADLRSEIAAKMGSLHDDFQDVASELSKLSATVQRLEESQNSTHSLLVSLYSDSSRSSAETQEMLQGLFSTLDSAVTSIEELKGDVSADKLDAIVASITTQLSSNSKQNSNDEEANEIIAAINKSIASGLAAKDKTSAEEMKAIARSIAELRDDMRSLGAQNKAMHEDIRFVRQEFAKHSTMLQTILAGESRVPTLMVILPKDPKSLKGKLKRLFSDVMHIYFVCPATMRLGQPYKLTIPKGWVVKVAPLIKMSLLMLKVALLCVGLPIPIPIPDFPADSFSGLLSQLENCLCDELLGDESAMDVLDEVDSVMAAVDALKVDDAASARKLKTQQSKMSALTKSSYAEVYDLLQKLETQKEKGAGSSEKAEWTPRHTGLVRLTSHCDGTTAWVLNDPKVVAEFHEKGKAALQVI